MAVLAFSKSVLAQFSDSIHCSASANAVPDTFRISKVHRLCLCPV
jgi:hypothetical protein